MQIKKHDDRYELRFDYRDIEGKRKFVVRLFNTKLDAKNFYLDFQRKIEDQKYRGNFLTVKQYLKDWLIQIETQVAVSTFQRYKIMCEKTISEQIGHLKMSEVQAFHVQKMLSDIRASGLSQTTVKHAYRTIYRAFKMAWQVDIVKENVVAKLDTPKVVKGDIFPLQPKEQQKLVNQLDIDFKANKKEGELQAWQNKVFFTLALNTGMRRGELGALQFGDINWERGTIMCSKAVVCPNGKIGEQIIKKPKNNKSRSILLYQADLKLLKQYRAFLNEEVLRLKCNEVLDEDWLFPSFKDSYNHRNTPVILWTNRFKSILKRAKLNSARLHDLRHTHISNLLADSSVPIKAISDRVGHSSIAVTCDIYGHLMPSQTDSFMNDALENIGKRLYAS